MNAQNTYTHRPVYIWTIWNRDRRERKKQRRLRNIDQTAKSQRINRVTEVENRKKKADVPQNVCLWEGVCVGGEGVLEGWGYDKDRSRRAIIDREKTQVNTKMGQEGKKHNFTKENHQEATKNI